ncbi:MAG: DsbC family protein [Mariprofundaceae bacterium]
MKRLFKQLSILAILLLPAMAIAADSPSIAPKVAEHIRAQMPELPIKSIQPTPIIGLYELQVGDQIFYSDRNGRYHIYGGHMIDIKKKQDLTAQRLERINTVDWSTLPLNKAIVSGDPKGKAVAIFTDPDCPYCKKLEENLKGVTGIKIYTFLFPLDMHPDAHAKSESIWCAKDQHAALQQVMIEGKTLPKATCSTPIADIKIIAQKMNITGTPTFIADDGRKRAGIGSAEQLKQWLNAK